MHNGRTFASVFKLHRGYPDSGITSSWLSLMKYPCWVPMRTWWSHSSILESYRCCYAAISYKGSRAFAKVPHFSVDISIQITENNQSPEPVRGFVHTTVFVFYSAREFPLATRNQDMTTHPFLFDRRSDSPTNISSINSFTTQLEQVANGTTDPSSFPQTTKRCWLWRVRSNLHWNAPCNTFPARMNTTSTPVSSAHVLSDRIIHQNKKDNKSQLTVICHYQLSCILHQYLHSATTPPPASLYRPLATFSYFLLLLLDRRAFNFSGVKGILVATASYSANKKKKRRSLIQPAYTRQRRDLVMHTHFYEMRTPHVCEKKICTVKTSSIVLNFHWHARHLLR